MSNWEAVENRLVDDTAPEWLKLKKSAALTQLKTLDLPGRKLENWRYTDSKRLVLKSNESSSQSADLHEVKLVDDAFAVVVRLDESGFSVSKNCPDNLVVKSLYEMPLDKWVDIELDQETVINLENTAAFAAGVFVDYQGNDLEQPLHLTIDYAFKDLNAWRLLRNQISIAENKHLYVTEKWSSGQVNATNVYNLAAHSQVTRAQLAALDSDQRFISFNQFELADKTQVKSINQHVGGFLQHHIHRVNFNGEQALFKMGTVNKSFDNNNIADLVQVNHNHKSNQSDVTHRSIADGQSQIFTNAKAYVAVGADDSEIEQDLKNILLSPDAKIFSKPELEVYADEVVAAHGSTIGALDEASLFYLQSRGIDIKQARAIMIESFEQEALAC